MLSRFLSDTFVSHVQSLHYSALSVNAYDLQFDNRQWSFSTDGFVPNFLPMYLLHRRVRADGDRAASGHL